LRIDFLSNSGREILVTEGTGEGTDWFHTNTVKDFFYFLLTEHLCIILVINQLNAQILLL